jgi:RNA polymerase sigma-70 factor (ECF subfamily)
VAGAALLALADEELIELATDGEVRAFEVIFDRHASAAFSLAYRICRRRAMAEDVSQEAFLSMWRLAGRYDRTRGSVRSWLLTVVHNRAIDACRRMQVSERRSVDDADIAERLPAPCRTENEVIQRDDARRVRAALEELPSDQRRVIELAYFAGLTHVQIAEALELPAGTVKGRMRLGLQKLRVALGSSAAPTPSPQPVLPGSAERRTSAIRAA